ncbi:SDR family NAD(P)-dependent oxidoreductase [Paenibacillus yanchengensis]|uniref:SDR family NAD(P)-dependent oxidoreductase n=1 Tax=Paenibacillus yanchengensis TaxID=2035833 RepID=A0ABW4YF32_9BACL
MHRYNWLEKILFLPTRFERVKLQRALEGKTILITGASSGIGEQVAYLLADVNVHMILVARSEEKLAAIKQKIEQKRARVTVIKADLRNDDEQDVVLQYIHELPDGLDIVVSNAGHSIVRSIFHSLDRYHDFTRTMAINYFAPVRLLLSLLPLLEKNQGQLINVSTINVLIQPLTYGAAYQSSKAAFHVWLQSVAPELHARGIITTSIYLPLVKTPMIVPTTAYTKMPAMSPAHVANIICKTMYTKKRQYKPWWGVPLQWASIGLSGVWLRVTSRIVKRGRE